MEIRNLPISNCLSASSKIATMKLFQFSDFWTPRRSSDSAERIERTIDDRSRRPIAGVAIDSKFSTASGSLVVAKGRGKFCRVLFHDQTSVQLPGPLRESLLAVTSQAAPSITAVKACGVELADVQRRVVEQLQQKASRYVDRILAVSIVDPGLWVDDFDGRQMYLPLSDPTRIAESTGLSVIDAFPSRDLEVGGLGKPLDLLPWWLLLADRGFPVSKDVNGLVCIGDRTSIVLFAPSDGLDATVPSVFRFETHGRDLLQALIQIAFQSPPDQEEIRKLLVAGSHSKSLLSAWHKTAPEGIDAMLGVARSAVDGGVDIGQLFSTFSKWLFETCEIALGDGLVFLAEEHRASQRLLEEKRKAKPVERFNYKPDFSCVANVFLDADSPVCDCLSAMLRGSGSFKVQTSLELATSKPNSRDQSLSQDANHDSLVAALLGLLHIDQIPANMPALTGANQQRILGRISPGRPHQWRLLVREMADFQPPALKLRDAV